MKRGIVAVVAVVMSGLVGTAYADGPAMDQGKQTRGHISR